jgi:tetratricopeptide (TPR) repeat protein/energy-coupling factor transporter ATP-binding protein EcfA2
MAAILSYEAPAQEAKALPVMMPAKLVGREQLLGQVYNQLKTNKAVCITGVPGIGKTALASALASAYTELPGGVLWLEVDNASLEELIVRVGRAYGDEDISASSNPLGMVGAVANVFSSNKPLIVLDGRHDAKATSDFVTRCAANMPLLIVSKDALQGPWTTVEVGKLESAAAINLLKQAADLQQATDVDDDLDELASILDYIPFALTIAGGTMRLAKLKPADYLTEFEKIPSSSGATPQLLALTAGFRKLNNAFQGVVLQLGAAYGAPVSAEIMSMIANAKQEVIEQVMGQLALGNVVERFYRYDAPSYRLHEITATFANTWLRSQNKLDGPQQKVRDAVVDYVKKYSVNSPAAHDKLSAAMDLILAVARWCADNGERDTVNQIQVSLMQAGDFVNERGYVSELLRLRQMSSSYTQPFPANPVPVSPEDMLDAEDEEIRDIVDEEEEDFDDNEPFDDELEEEVPGLEGDEDDEDEAIGPLRQGAASAVGSLWGAVESGMVNAPSSRILDEDEDDDDFDDLPFKPVPPPTLEEPADVLDKLRQQLRLAKQTGDLPKQVDLLRQIGQMEAERGMDNEAINTYADALAAYESLDERENILETLDTLSALMVKTENSSAAVLHASRGLALADQLVERETKMQLNITLGDARQQLGESDEAMRAYGNALEIARTDDDKQFEALILHKLGYAQLDSSDADTAAETWEQALKLFKAQNKRDYEGRVLGALGTAYGELGRWIEAVNFHTSALYIAREVKDKEVEALELANLGYASVQANQLGQALLRYRQALHLAYTANNRDNIITNIVDIVRLLTESPRHLGIADLLINDAIVLDPTDREVLKLKERVTGEKMQAMADSVQLLAVGGTAKEYAANAYKLLDEQ